MRKIPEHLVGRIVEIDYTIYILINNSYCQGEIIVREIEEDDNETLNISDIDYIKESVYGEDYVWEDVNTKNIQFLAKDLLDKYERYISEKNDKKIESITGSDSNFNKYKGEIVRINYTRYCSDFVIINVDSAKTDGFLEVIGVESAEFKTIDLDDIISINIIVKPIKDIDKVVYDKIKDYLSFENKRKFEEHQSLEQYEPEHKHDSKKATEDDEWSSKGEQEKQDEKLVLRIKRKEPEKKSNYFKEFLLGLCIVIVVCGTMLLVYMVNG